MEAVQVKQGIHKKTKDSMSKDGFCMSSIVFVFCKFTLLCSLWDSANLFHMIMIIRFC